MSTYEVGCKFTTVRFISDEHEGGTKVPETHCDWTFRSRDSKDGNIHTPDHISHSGTLCTFSFLAEYNERVEIRIVVNRHLE